MNFFAHQDSARRRTFLLLLLLLAALAVVVCAIYALLMIGLKVYTAYPAKASIDFAPAPWPFWNPSIFGIVFFGVGALVLGGSLWKYRQLASGGGWIVAQMVGADSLCPDTQDADEKRFLNVVEEMSIASGVPVPMIFLLRETRGINAFVAGTSYEDVVLVATQGCLTALSRAEQQAIVAHEFSHILNGDMRFNLRLMGVVHGILLLAIVGRGLCRPKVKDARALALLVMSGLILLAVGTVGAFCGRIIKFAITRQREFLADAYAVQFTRNPEALIKVLLRIKGTPSGSHIRSPQAEALSHMFFAQGVAGGLSSLFATHPPIETRIRRIDPRLNAIERERIAATIEAPAADATAALPSPGAAFAVSAEAAAAPIANDFEQLQFAQRFLAGLPQPVLAAARQPDAAEALIYALLLSGAPPLQGRRPHPFGARCPAEVGEQVEPLLGQLGSGSRETRLMIADLALPALKRLPVERFRQMQANVRELAAADQKIDFFEYALQKAFLKRVAALETQPKGSQKIRYRTTDQLRMELTELMSLLAWQVNHEKDAAERAFRKGMHALGPGAGPLNILPREKCSLKRFDNALARLDQATPKVRRSVLSAVDSCLFDGGTGFNLEKIVLLRVAAHALDLPPSPFGPIQSQTVPERRGAESKGAARHGAKPTKV